MEAICVDAPDRPQPSDLTGLDLDIGCSFTFGLAAPTHAVMLFEPHVSDLDRVVESALEIVGHAPLPATSTYVDSFGNRCRRITRFIRRARASSGA